MDYRGVDLSPSRHTAAGNPNVVPRQSQAPADSKKSELAGLAHCCTVCRKQGNVDNPNRGPPVPQKANRNGRPGGLRGEQQASRCRSPL